MTWVFAQLLLPSTGSETAGQGESLLETEIGRPLLQALTLPGSPTDSAFMSSKVVLGGQRGLCGPWVAST